MHWLSTASAWFLFSCLLIIAMYMLKKRYEPTSISSYLLWRKALLDQEANKPWQRLKQRLLLWLQLLIAIVIVLALMEPVIVKQLARDSHVIVLLDRSTSMVTTTDENGEPFFEKAKNELLQWLEHQFDGGALTLVVNGDYPDILINRSQSLLEIKQAIKEIQPYYGVSDDATALSLVNALAQEKENTSIRFYIDHHFKVEQRQIQQEVMAAAEWHTYGNAEALSGDDRIRSFTLTSRDYGVSAFITILHETIANHQQEVDNPPSQQVTQASNEPFDLTIEVFDKDGAIVHEENITKHSEQTGVTTIQVEGLPHGYYYAAIVKQRINDRNPYNNKEYGLISGQSAGQALLISDGNLFLEKTLQLMNVGVTKLAANAKTPAQEVLEGVQFLIVDGSYDQLVQDAAWEELLRNYPVWIFDHPTEQEAAQLTGKQPIVHQHQITTYFSMEDTYISAVRKLGLDELADYDVLVEYGGAPVIIAGIDQQRPFLRFAFALQDSDLPLRAPFPVLMMQSIEYMSSGSSQQLGSMLVGSEPTLTLQAQSSSSYWNNLVLHDEKRVPDRSSVMTIHNDDGIIAPRFPGVYELVEQDNAGTIIQQRIAVVQADSSEFSYMKDEYKQDQAKKHLEDLQSQNFGWSSLIPWLAALLLLLLIAEWEVYRRGL